MPTNPVTQGRARLVAECGVGAEAVRAYAVRYTPGQHMPTHTHDAASVSIILVGGCEDADRGDAADGRAHNCPPLTVVVKPPGAPHETRMLDRGMISLVIQLPRGHAMRMTDEAGDRAELGRCRWLHAGGPAAGPVLSLWLDLLAGRAEADEAMARLGPVFTANGRPLSEPAPELIEAQRLIDRGRSVGAAATAVGLHPSHLTRRFRAELGTTPSERARLARLGEAVGLVLGTRDSLSRCALASGYADQAHMTRRFRAELGLTPGRLTALRRIL